MRDIQKLKHLTETLHEVEELERLANKRLKTALAAAGAGVWDWDLDTDILRWDDRMLELFGYEIGSFIKDEQGWNLCKYSHFSERIHKDDKDKVQKLVDVCIVEREPYRTSYRVVHPGGRIIKLINAAGDVHVSQTGNERLVGVCFDIEGMC